MKNQEDYWAGDDFEDTVASALIACFETKIKKNKGAAPSDRLNEDRVSVMRSEGPYIASNSRLVILPNEDRNCEFDMVNDKLPVKGLHAFKPDGLVSKDKPNSYLIANYIRQAPALGKFWNKRANGTLYEMLQMSAENDAIHGERRFFTVTKNGEVVACDQRIPLNVRQVNSGETVNVFGHESTWLRETSTWAAVALQILSDRQYCWTISAQEKVAKAHLGCMMDEVKSLLYARSLPLSSTGRKRPILHLVEAHKRRMRNGTDIDVTTFLRGQQTVEIGGTMFKVNPPANLRQVVSKPSSERYYDSCSACYPPILR